MYLNEYTVILKCFGCRVLRFEEPIALRHGWDNNFSVIKSDIIDDFFNFQENKLRPMTGYDVTKLMSIIVGTWSHRQLAITSVMRWHQLLQTSLIVKLRSIAHTKIIFRYFSYSSFFNSQTSVIFWVRLTRDAKNTVLSECSHSDCRRYS